MCMCVHTHCLRLNSKIAETSDADAIRLPIHPTLTHALVFVLCSLLSHLFHFLSTPFLFFPLLIFPLLSSPFLSSSFISSSFLSSSFFPFLLFSFTVRQDVPGSLFQIHREVRRPLSYTSSPPLAYRYISHPPWPIDIHIPLMNCTTILFALLHNNAHYFALLLTSRYALHTTTLYVGWSLSLFSYGVATVLDPILVIIVDLAMHNYSCARYMG